MATVLYGWTWYGDDEPTVGVLPTQEWRAPTSGEIYVRDTSNASWVYAGNVNNRMGGAVEVAGSTMTGSLLDVPNLLPVADPDATGTIRQGGFPVALMTSLAALEKRIYDRIIYQVREQYLSQLRRSVIGSSMAFGYPDVYNGNPVPLPFYDDGIQATVDQIVVLVPAIARLNYIDRDDYAYQGFMQCTINPTTLVVTCLYDRNVVHRPENVMTSPLAAA